MAVEFRSKGAWCAGTTSVSFTMPTTHVAGDLLLMFIHTCNNPITTAPANGWALLSPSPVSTGTASTALGVRLTVYWKIAASSSEASQTVAVTSGTATNGITVAYSGVDNTTPFDVTPTSSVQATSIANFSCPTITTANNNAMIVNAVGLDNDIASTTLVSARANASLVSITQDHGQAVSTGTGGGIFTSHGIKATAGLVSATTGTVAAAARAMMTIALRPQIIVNTNKSLTSNYSVSSSLARVLAISKTLATGITANMLNIESVMRYNLFDYSLMSYGTDFGFTKDVSITRTANSTIGSLVSRLSTLSKLLVANYTSASNFIKTYIPAAYVYYKTLISNFTISSEIDEKEIGKKLSATYRESNSFERLISITKSANYNVTSSLNRFIYKVVESAQYAISSNINKSILFTLTSYVNASCYLERLIDKTISASYTVLSEVLRGFVYSKELVVGYAVEPFVNALKSFGVVLTTVVSISTELGSKGITKALITTIKAGSLFFPRFISLIFNRPTHGGTSFVKNNASGTTTSTHYDSGTTTSHQSQGGVDMNINNNQGTKIK